MHTKKAMLLILDGWGLGQNAEADAIAQANTPVFDQLWRDYPHNTLVTYGEEVGLPEGQMGNSEVGHLNIGAGRVVYQAFARINKAVRDGDLAKTEKLQRAIAYAQAENKAIHLMGLVSEGGVHSHQKHLMALVDIIEKAGHEHTYLHAFTDGRDTDPQSGRASLATVLDHLKGKSARLATVVGRFFAMDRDQRWERIQKAYNLLVKGEGATSNDVLATLAERYAQDQTDEFLEPILVTDADGQAAPSIQDGDVLICFNFRTDRPRQISAALTQTAFPDHGMQPLNLRYLTMTQYDQSFQNVEVLFEKDNLQNTLGEVLSAAGKTQVRIAETEKYPHVTFFFNGGREEPFEQEERILIPSPKEVNTYDEKPAMSAPEITEAILNSIEDQQPDFICLNFANTDMVGHTGDFQAAVAAAETVDECLGRLVRAAEQQQYELLVIADHGNADFMVNADGSPHTAHTLNPVPVIYVHQRPGQWQIRTGKLGDVAPTLLWMYGLEAPAEMDGQVLIESK
ncbi:MAG: 2,3-bisphosphoglycerate-independent phosphoglycerate mutase [Bacteroidota bacterium]